MAIADPKSYMTKTKATDEHDDADGESTQAQIAELQQQVQALLKMQASGGGLTEDRLEKILLKVASVTADAAERAANPSNKTHPGMSVFSYPEGDRARPRALKCPMFWGGYDLNIDTITAQEVELLNLAEPGIYKFTRSDNTLDTLTVEGERNAADTITKLNFRFLIEDNLETLPGMVRMLQTAFKVKTAQEQELEAMRLELEAMRRQVAVGA